MTKAPKRIDISRMPELLTLAQEVRATNEPAVLQQDSEDVALLSPVRPKKRSPTKAQRNRSPGWSSYAAGCKS
jgi:hypothetical protein